MPTGDFENWTRSIRPRFGYLEVFVRFIPFSLPVASSGVEEDEEGSIRRSMSPSHG
jgi:hypothetical protein